MYGHEKELAEICALKSSVGGLRRNPSREDCCWKLLWNLTCSDTTGKNVYEIASLPGQKRVGKVAKDPQRVRKMMPEIGSDFAIARIGALSRLWPYPIPKSGEFLIRTWLRKTKENIILQTSAIRQLTIRDFNMFFVIVKFSANSATIPESGPKRLS